MARKPRIDSTSEAVRVVSRAATAIVPPSSVPLEKCDLPFFASVIAEFARSEWTAHQLELAAMLARTMADLNREQQELRDEGSVVKTDKGTPVVNPRKAVVQMHASSILSFRRSLSLHARAQGGEARDVAKRRSGARAIEAGNPLDDELLALQLESLATGGSAARSRSQPDPQTRTAAGSGRVLSDWIRSSPGERNERAMPLRRTLHNLRLAPWSLERLEQSPGDRLVENIRVALTQRLVQARIQLRRTIA
jgi:hypothetical protein